MADRWHCLELDFFKVGGARTRVGAAFRSRVGGAGRADFGGASAGTGAGWFGSIVVVLIGSCGRGPG